MPGDYKFTRMSVDERMFVDWLIFDMNVPPEDLDIDPHGPKGAISFEEAAAYALKDENWRKYLPGLDIAGLKHPADFRYYDPKVRKRIEDIARQAQFNAEFVDGISPHDDLFCNHVLKHFYELGAGTFAEGGLCFEVYTKRDFATLNAGLTSKEIFNSCMNLQSPPQPLGFCVGKASVQIGSALSAAKESEHRCVPEVILTQGHVYVSLGGVEYDPADIGSMGWTRPADIAAEYYYQLGEKGDSKAMRIASIIDPTNHTCYDDIIFLLRRGRYDEALNHYDPIVLNNYKNITPFFSIEYISEMMPPVEAEELIFAVLRRWPDSPHVLIPLLSLNHLKDEHVRIAERLSAEFPNSGWAETARAFCSSDTKKSEELYIEALSLNDNNPVALQGLASIKAARGDLAGAERLARMSVDIAPAFPNGHAMMSMIHQVRGDYGSLRSEAEKEENIFNGNKNHLFLKASLFTSIGSYDDAMDVLNHIIEKTPDDYNVVLSNAHALLAVAHANRNAWGDKNTELDLARENLELARAYYDDDSEFLRQIEALIDLQEMGDWLGLGFDYSGIELRLSEMDDDLWITKVFKMTVQMHKFEDDEMPLADEILMDLNESIPDAHFLSPLTAWMERRWKNYENAFDIYSEAYRSNGYDFNSFVGIMRCRNSLLMPLEETMELGRWSRNEFPQIPGGPGLTYYPVIYLPTERIFHSQMWRVLED